MNQPVHEYRYNIITDMVYNRHETHDMLVICQQFTMIRRTVEM